MHSNTTNALTKSKSFLFAVSAMLIVQTFAHAQQTGYETPEGMKFLVYTPPGYTDSTNTSYPVLLALHGASEIGDDLTELTVNAQHKLPSRLIFLGEWPASRPFIVVSPQLKRDPSMSVNDQEWDPDSVDNVLEYVKDNFRVDTNRVYLTGISSGGAGAWKYAASYPNKITALVPISGKTDLADAGALSNLPIWAFHGEGDGIVNPLFSKNMVTAVNASQPPGLYNAHLTLLHVLAHAGWNEIYDASSGYDIYSWFLKFSKNSTANTLPFVTAGADKKVLSRAAGFHLYGEFFDSDGGITNVTWSQVSGPSVTLQDIHSNFAKVTNLVAGTLVFRLTVTDNAGEQKYDNVTFEVLDSIPVGTITVTDLMLTNANEQLIGSLSEDQVINTTALGSNLINIKATVTGGTINSVRFSVNGNQNTRTATTTDPNNYFIISPTTRWQILNGEYEICATPYSQKFGTGTPGVSQCYTVVVTDQAIVTRNFYAKQDNDIGVLASWGTNTDGSGDAPLSFTAHEQIFNITTSSVLNTALSISGTGSSLNVREGGQLTVNNAVSTPIHAAGNAIININTAQAVMLGVLDTGTTVNFNAEAIQIPPAEYGNLTVRGPESTKTLATGVTTVMGDMTIEDDVMVNGAADSTSIVRLGGNFNLMDNETFLPLSAFSIQLTGGDSLQLLNIGSTHAAFRQLALDSGAVAAIQDQPLPITLQLGYSGEGGLRINNLARLDMNANHLAILGTLNSGNEQGQLGMNNGNLVITSQSNDHSYLYPAAGADSIGSMILNLSGAGQWFLQDTVYVSDSLKCSNGVINTNGNLCLISTKNKTAQIAAIEGTGDIIGPVIAQRWIERGKIYRYVSFPVSGMKVSDLQAFMPVTGNFTGASTGGGLSSEPSIFHYAEPAGWTAFPESTNEEQFTLGKGYSVYMRHDTRDLTLAMKGEAHEGDFQFALIPDPNTAEPNDGWNLVGNPYVSPIQWGTTGWISEGINQTISIRDNSYPGGGRFLVWDGTTGDPEFGGLIATGQSFWVRSISATPNLTIQENAKISRGDVTLYRGAGHEQHHNLAVTLKHKNLLDRTYLKFVPNGGDNFENHLDAIKQKNNHFNLSTLSADSVLLAINNVSDHFCSKDVSLSLENTAEGQYTLSFDGTAFDNGILSKVILTDHYRDSVINVRAGHEYGFSITTDPKSRGHKRFTLTMLTNELADPVITVEGNTLTSVAEEGAQYQWLFNGEIITAATEASLTAYETGTYQLQVTRGSCSKVSEPVSFRITDVTDAGIAKEISIYPNPASRYLWIEGLPAANKHIAYTLLSTTGMTVRQGEIDTRSKGRQATAIRVDDLQQGLYILKLNSGEYQKRIKVFIER